MTVIHGVTHVNGWCPDVYMSYTSQNFLCFTYRTEPFKTYVLVCSCKRGASLLLPSFPTPRLPLPPPPSPPRPLGHLQPRGRARRAGDSGNRAPLGPVSGFTSQPAPVKTIVCLCVREKMQRPMTELDVIVWDNIGPRRRGGGIRRLTDSRGRTAAQRGTSAWTLEAGLVREVPRC